MLEIKCSIKIEDSEYILEAAEDSTKKTNIWLIKISKINSDRTDADNIGDVEGKIAKARLEIQGHVEVTVDDDSGQAVTIIEITPVKRS